MLVKWFGLVLVALSLFCGVAHAEQDPQRLVRSTADQVLAAVTERKDALKKHEGAIYGLVRKIVVPRFDFRRMTRSAMGRFWRRADGTQQERLVNEFQELLVRTYATALLNYTGQKIQYLPVRKADEQDEVTVSTRITTEGGPPIPINYRLHRVNGAWLVYDVTIDGISLVINYRSSFANIVRRQGIEGLISRLSKRNTKLRGA